MELSPAFLRDLELIVGPRGVVSSREGRLTYEADMHTFYKGAPDAVVLPETALQVAEIVKLCRRSMCRWCPVARERGSSVAPWRRSAA